MKNGSFLSKLFILFLFLIINSLQASFAANIETTVLAVPIKDLTESIKPDGKKYFMMPVSEYEKLKNEKEQSIAANSKKHEEKIYFANITSTKIKGYVGEKFIFAKAQISVEKVGDRYAEIPILHGKIAVEKALLNEKQVPLSVMWGTNHQNKYLYPFTDKKIDNNINAWHDVEFSLRLFQSGTYNYEISFVIPIEEYDISKEINFSIGKSPISSIELKFPNIVDIDETNILSSEMNISKDEKSEFKGQLGSTSDIIIKWRNVIPAQKQKPKQEQEQKKEQEKLIAEKEEPRKETQESLKSQEQNLNQEKTQEKLDEQEEIPEPPKPMLFAHSTSMFFINRDSINVDKHIEYSITRASVNELSFEIPRTIESKDISIQTKRISQLNRPRIVNENDKRILKIALPTSILDNFELDISYIQKLTASDTSFILPEFVPVGVERDLGNIAVVSMSSDEIRSANSETQPLNANTNEIDATELPSALKAKADRPILLAYNYSSSPSNIGISIIKCDDVKQQYTVADNMTIRTTFNTNQTSNTEIEINLKNTNNNKHLQLMLASGTNATFSSCAVNGKIQRIGAGASGTAIIPLPSVKNSLNPETTNILVSLKQNIATISLTGALQFQPPVPNIPVSKVYWKLYAPETLHLYGFNGTVNKIKENDLPFFLKGFTFCYEMAKNFFTDTQTILGIFIIVAIVLAIAFFKPFISLLKSIISGFGSAISAIFNTFSSKPEQEQENAKTKSGFGFSLIELGIVIFIIGFLASMAQPNYRTSRWQSRQKACYSNIRVLQGAIEMYNMDNPNYISSGEQLHNLTKGYIKAIPSCPENPGKADQYKGENLQGTGQLYCGKPDNGGTIMNQGRHHGFIDPVDEATVRSLEMKSVNSYAKMNDSLSAPRARSFNSATKSISRAEEAKTDKYGAQYKKAARPLITQLTTTSNLHEFSRDLLLPEIDENGSLKPNSTYPEIKFGYVKNSYLKAVNVGIAIIAIITALGLVFGAINWNMPKIITSTIIIFVLTYIDMDYKIIGNMFNPVFWSVLCIGIVIVLLKRISIENSDEAKPITNKSGSAHIIIALLVAFSALTAVPAFSQEESAKNIQVLSPISDFSKVIPENGNVVFITEEDYNYLKDLEKPQNPIQPIPYNFVIKSISYEAKEEKDSVKFVAKFSFEKLKKGYIEIPLIADNTIATSLKLDGQTHPLSFAKDGKYKATYCLFTDKEGEHEAELEFIVNSVYDTNDEYSPREISFNTIIAGISILKFIPKDNKEISIEVNPAALKQENNKEDNSFTAIIHPTKTITIRITPKKPELTEEEKAVAQAKAAEEEARQKAEEEALLKEKDIIDETEPEHEEIIETIPTKVVSTCNIGLYVKDIFLEGIAECQIGITGTKGINKFGFKIPQNIKLMNVFTTERTNFIRDWQDTETEDGRFVLVNFSTELIETRKSITIIFEQDLKGNKEKSFEVPEIKPLNTDKTSGFLVMNCLPELELTAGTPEGYVIMNADTIPNNLKSFVKNEAKYVYEYSDFPNSLTVNVTRPENLNAVTAIIDRAEAVTSISPEGDVFTKYKFQIRNNSEQFLKIKLPERNGKTAELWESRCNGEPVIVGNDSKNKTINIPIIKSPLGHDDEPEKFYAEIVLHEKINPLDVTGTASLTLPSPHLTITKLIWQIKTPEGYEAVKQDGNIEANETQNVSFIYFKDSYTKTAKSSIKKTGIFPVTFALPNYENYKNYAIDEVDPEKPAPFLNLKLYGKPKSNAKKYVMLSMIIGCLLGFSTIQIIRKNNHKAIYITLFLITLSIVAQAITTSAAVSKVAVTAAFATMFLYLIALLLKQYKKEA